MTEGTKSGFDTERNTCSAMIDHKGESRQCQRQAVGAQHNDAWWCGLHHPGKTEQRRINKEAKAEAVAKASSQVVVDTRTVEPEAPGVTADELVQSMGEKAEMPTLAEAMKAVADIDESLTGLLDESSSAMSELHAIAMIKDIGWPESTPPAKYSIILGEINQRAMKAGDALRDSIAKARAARPA